MYSIIDVETTGMGSTGNKITDISIFVHDGEKVINEFHSLVDPEKPIPYKIVQLTGITDQMVRGAPKFREIAKTIFDITRDTVFIAHNVSFDYGVIRSEFKSLSFNYEREKLCTVQMSRKILPGHKSYSLGRLCDDLGIIIDGRHRAEGDARATVELFDMLLDKDEKREFINKGIDKKTIESILPPLLSIDVVNKIPNTIGVYYFHNSEGEIIYVGKSINIRNGVLSHFRDKAQKELRMCLEIVNVTYEETGTKLIALLKESADIKEFHPSYNKAQKKSRETYGVVTYEDQSGIMRLGYNQLKLVSNPIQYFYSQKSAKQFLEKLCDDFHLCPKFCQIQFSNEKCSNAKTKKCKGICYGEESKDDYNQRVKKALSRFTLNQITKLIKGNGRNESESSFVYIEKGTYKGYGYVNKELGLTELEVIENHMKEQNHNGDVQKILNSTLRTLN